jgi:hypothetical protein
MGITLLFQWVELNLSIIFNACPTMFTAFDTYCPAIIPSPPAGFADLLAVVHL